MIEMALTHGYSGREIEAAQRSFAVTTAWTATPVYEDHDNRTDTGWLGDDEVDVDDIPEDIREEMSSIVSDFMSLIEDEMSDEDMTDYADAVGRSGVELAAQIGHDFALTREHHGAGFWDVGAGEAGRNLTDWAHSFSGGGLLVMVATDGAITFDFD